MACVQRVRDQMGNAGNKRLLDGFAVCFWIGGKVKRNRHVATYKTPQLLRTNPFAEKRFVGTRHVTFKALPVPLCVIE